MTCAGPWGVAFVLAVHLWKLHTLVHGRQLISPVVNRFFPMLFSFPRKIPNKGLESRSRAHAKSCLTRTRRLRAQLPRPHKIGQNQRKRPPIVQDVADGPDKVGASLKQRTLIQWAPVIHPKTLVGCQELIQMSILNVIATRILFQNDQVIFPIRSAHKACPEHLISLDGDSPGTLECLDCEPLSLPV